MEKIIGIPHAIVDAEIRGAEGKLGDVYIESDGQRYEIDIVCRVERDRVLNLRIESGEECKEVFAGLVEEGIREDWENYIKRVEYFDLKIGDVDSLARDIIVASAEGEKALLEVLKGLASGVERERVLVEYTLEVNEGGESYRYEYSSEKFEQQEVEKVLEQIYSGEITFSDGWKALQEWSAEFSKNKGRGRR